MGTKRKSPSGTAGGPTKKELAAANGRVAKVPLTDLSAVDDFVLTDHAIERMAERRITPAEVYSAIAQPDYIVSESGLLGRVKRASRGDVSVAYDPRARTVLTVIDLDEDTRTGPRVPAEHPRVLARHARTPAIEPADPAPPRVREPLPEDDEVRWLLGRHEQPDIRYVNVSPVIAEKLLTMNTRNRPIRRDDVAAWVAEMAGGDWLVTHQGIGIATDGVIVDGQHRLLGIVESGATVRMPVAVGLDPKTFDVIDAGRVRSAGDALAMRGEVSVQARAATTRLLYAYEHGTILDRTSLAKLSTARTAAYFEQHADAIRAGGRYGAMCRKHFRAKVPAMAVLHILAHRAAANRPDLAGEFFDRLLSGDGLRATDARFRLRAHALNTFGDRRASIEQLALGLKAWRFWCIGRPVVYFGWRAGEEMPAVYVPPPDLPVPGHPDGAPS